MMDTNRQLPRKWGFIFAAIGIAALAVSVFALVKEEYVIAIATGIVFCLQAFNFVKWMRQR